MLVVLSSLVSIHVRRLREPSTDSQSTMPSSGSSKVGRTLLVLLSHDVLNVVTRAAAKDISQALSSLLALCRESIAVTWLLAMSDQVDGGLGTDGRSGSKKRHESTSEMHVCGVLDQEG